MSALTVRCQLEQDHSYKEKESPSLTMEGGEQAFLLFYRQYHQPLYAYIIRFVKVPSIAEDLLQDVFLKLWQIKDRINPNLSIQAYLYRISRNVVFKALKKISSDHEMRSMLLHQMPQHISDSELHLQWRQYEKTLQEAISLLPAQRKKVFQLCRIEGKSYDETAQLLNISRNTVKEHMTLAMRCIKEHFNKNSDISLGLFLYFAYYTT